MFFLSIMAISGLFISLVNGCSSGPTTPGQLGATQTTTIYGRVVDETGAAVIGVSVAAGTMTAVTDTKGLFVIKNATVPQGRAVVIAKKSGYFNAAHAEVPQSNGTTRIDLSMMTDGTTGSVSATNGGTVNVAGGASIAFAGGSFTDASGSSYSGIVNVAARYLDPKNETFFDYFSGDDIAQTASGKTASLTSSGVLRVELHGSTGQVLKLDASKPATLSYPKPIDPKAPAIMPLWYFDESLGMWKEEGKATLNNGFYTGTVSHFTDWNLDYFDSSTGTFGTYGSVDLRVVCNGVPISGVSISIIGDDAPGKYFVHPGGKTGPDGTLHFIRFPANRTTQVDISSTRNSGLYFINTPITVNLNPGQNLDLGDITLNSPCPASIQGSLVACDDSKAEGLVTVSDGVHQSYTYTRSGNFAVAAPATVVLTIDAMDVSGNQATTQTIPALASGELRDIGNIKVCGPATSNFVDITLTGQNKEGQILAISPDGTRLAAWQYQPSQFTIYDTKTGNVISTTPVTGQSNINAMHFSSDNNKLLLSTTYGATQLFDVSTATATMILSFPNILNAKLYDDGTKIVAAVSQPYPNPPLLNIYSAADGSVLKTLHPTNFGSSGDSTGSFGFIHSEEAIVYPDGNAGGTARVWSLQSDAELRNFAFTGQPYLFLSSDDGSTVTSSSDNLTYFCYDTKTGLKSGTIILPTSQNGRYGYPAVTMNFLYTGEQANGANVIRIWKIADGSSTLKLLSGTSYVNSIAASRNEQYLTASTSGLIRIWKLQ